MSYTDPLTRKKTNDEDLCSWVKGLKGPNVLIGDMNFPDIDWQNRRAGSKGRDFYDATAEVFMEQHVKFPTHDSGNVLDLVLCNREGMIQEVKAEERVGKSDHNIVTFEICIGGRKERRKRETFNYRKTDFATMRKSLSETNWSHEWDGRDVNGMWDDLKKRIKGLMTTHIPMKTVKEMMQPPWMDKEVQKAIEKKRQAWKLWKETGSRKSKEEYKKKVTEAKKEIRNKKNALEKKSSKMPERKRKNVLCLPQ